jgi:hypothetical protein
MPYGAASTPVPGNKDCEGSASRLLETLGPSLIWAKGAAAKNLLMAAAKQYMIARERLDTRANPAIMFTLGVIIVPLCALCARIISSPVH